MANQEQLEILKQGIKVWNKWREDNPDVKIDLSDASFNGIDFHEANFSHADLSHANLSEAKLSEANLSEAELCYTDLWNTRLWGTFLSRANLRGASLISAKLDNANITGAKLYATARDEWRIENIKCDYVFWGFMEEYRTPADRDFSPGEFEKLYKWHPYDDFERLIERSIEFPPEYKQAGVSILNYFAEIIRKKYPESEATVQIKQDGLKVTMIIDTAKGEREIIEKTLNDYGLVITGQMTPEQFTDDKHQIIELKSELRIAQVRIEMQKDLLPDKSAQIDKLFLMLGNTLQTPQHIHISNQASGGNTINAQNVTNSALAAGDGNK